MRRLAAAGAAVVCAMFGFTSVAAGAPPPNQHPVVLSARATPSSLGANGGVVTVTGRVRGASTCSVAVLRDDHIKVSLPKQASCAKGTYSEHVRFGPNNAASAVDVRLGLVAGRARGVFYVSVAGIPHHPAVLSARATPWQLTYRGGTITVEGTLKDARVCRLAPLADHGVQLRLLVAKDKTAKITKPVNCADGAYREKILVGDNSFYRDNAVQLGLFPEGLVRKYAGVFFVSLAGKPKPPPPTTTTAATTTSTTSAPPVTSGLTTGLVPLGPLGPLPTTPPVTTTAHTTTTTSSTTTTTTATTTTTTAATTTTTAPTTTTTAPTTTTTAPTTTTTAAPAPTLVQEESSNWSGYAVGGTQTEPLTATSVTGTFTVPQLTYAASCNDAMSVWNGIDGSNDSYLIQAGVGLTTTDPYGPNAGTCTSGQFYIVPWWEVITPTNLAPETFIETWDDGTSATVNVGDQVTVTINEVSAGEWNIVLADNTTGETFNYFDFYGSYVSYDGPGASAEWIVEDTDQPNNPNCQPPTNGLYLCPMPAYDPSVSFTGSGFNSSGVYGQTDQIDMVDQNGNLVSEPSSLGTNGDFTVSYVGSGTNAPNGAARVKTLGSKLPSTARPSSPSLSPQPHVSPR